MSTKTRKLSQILFRRSSACKKLNISSRSAMSKDDSELLSRPLVTQSHQSHSQTIYTSKEALNMAPDVVNTSPSAEQQQLQPQQQPVKIHRRNSSNNSRNPLKEVHWSCPTLEKRREMILNYFENIMFVENNSSHNNQSNGKSMSHETNSTNANVNNRESDDHHEEINSEPIYEEIRDSHGNHPQMPNSRNHDTLKPKLAPKKAKVLHQNSASSSGGDHDVSPPDLQPRTAQANIYDSIIKNPKDRNHSTVIYENLPPKTEIGRNETKRSTPLVVTWKLDEDNHQQDWHHEQQQQSEQQHQEEIQECLYAKVDKKAKAKNSSKSTTIITMSAQQEASDANCSKTTTAENAERDGSAKKSESSSSLKQFPVNTEHNMTTVLANASWEDESLYPEEQLEQQNINIAHNDACEDKILPEKNLLEFQSQHMGNSSVIDTTDYDPTSYSLEYSSQDFDEETETEEEAGSYDFPLPPPEFLSRQHGDSDEYGYDYDYRAAEEIIWGEIDSDSIIENKEATKFYWEKRMRAGSTSDLTMSSMSLNNNRFLSSSSGSLSRHEAKYYDDTEEDGGFESFQVANLTDDGNYDVDGDNGEEPEAVDSLSAHSKGEDTSDTMMMTSISPDQGVVLNFNNNNNNNSKNKPAIKAHYRAATFAQSQQSIPPEELQQKAATVLDLINSEISDLHMREIELKSKIRSGHPNERNEDDGDVDGEDEGQQEGEQEELSGGNSEDEYNSDSAIDFESYTGTSNSSGNVTPASVFRGDSHTPNSDREQDILTGGNGMEDDELNKQSNTAFDNRTPTANPEEEVTKGKLGGKVRPLVEEELKSFQMTSAQETPIEREIRESRKREEEFRRLKSTSSIDVPASVEKEYTDNNSKQTSPAQETISVIHQSTPRKVSRNSFIMKDSNEVDGSSMSSNNKDIQYELATARLRREIEENLMREKELYREGRLKSISLGESLDSENSEKSQASDGVDGAEQKQISAESDDKAAAEKSDEHRNILPSQGKRPFGKLAIIKPEDKPMPSFSGPTVTSFSSLPPVTKRNSFELSSPTDNGSEPKTPLTPTTPLSRPSFNSIERYLLKSSFKFSIGKRFDMPTAPEATKEPKVEQVKTLAEVKEDKENNSSFDDVEEEKPRRKYIRAQDKIEIELKEMMQREKELSQLRAKWKSTPDLSSRGSNNTSGDEETNEEDTNKPKVLNGSVFLRDRKLSSDDISVGNVSISATKTPGFGKPTVRRRQSALINRWEELIKQQQQSQ